MLNLWYDLGRPGHQAKDHIEKQKTGSHADFLSALAIAVIQLLIVISNWASFNHIYDTNLDKDDATELEVALVARQARGHEQSTAVLRLAYGWKFSWHSLQLFLKFFLMWKIARKKVGIIFLFFICCSNTLLLKW